MNNSFTKYIDALQPFEQASTVTCIESFDSFVADQVYCCNVSENGSLRINNIKISYLYWGKFKPKKIKIYLTSYLKCDIITT